LSTLASLTLIAAAPGTALSQSGAKVRPPTQVEVNAARTGLDRGLVYLVEWDGAGSFVQATVFGRVNAPIETTFDVLADPALLTKMQPAMASVEERARHGNAITYRWQYDGILVDCEGLTAMALVRPQAVQWGLTKGFGPGTMLWRLFPDGDRTIATLSLNIDIRQASHTLIRWVGRHSSDAPPMWNLGHGILSVRGLQQVAATRAGRTGLPTPSGRSGSGPLRPLTAAQIESLRPLFQRGSAGLIEQDAQGSVSQATVIETVAAPPDRLKQILASPARWPEVLPPAVSIEIPEGAADPSQVHMTIATPGVSVESEIAVAARDDGVDVSSPSGRLRGSLLSFRVIPNGQGALLTGAGRFRSRESGVILRRMIDSDPYFAHGLNASALGIFVRGFKTGVERGR
jgi:hypothetical protein